MVESEGSSQSSLPTRPKVREEMTEGWGHAHERRLCMVDTATGPLSYKDHHLQLLTLSLSFLTCKGDHHHDLPHGAFEGHRHI